MLREAFSLQETRGVEQKCSSSLTVHFGHRLGTILTVWRCMTKTMWTRILEEGEASSNTWEYLSLSGRIWVEEEAFPELEGASGDGEWGRIPRSKRGVFLSTSPLLLFPRSSPHYWCVTSDFSLCTCSLWSSQLAALTAHLYLERPPKTSAILLTLEKTHFILSNRILSHPQSLFTFSLGIYHILHWFLVILKCPSLLTRL